MLVLVGVDPDDDVCAFPAMLVMTVDPFPVDSRHGSVFGSGGKDRTAIGPGAIRLL
ncbi:MAG: hypothetical protein ACXW15_02890 [Acidimicrobiia bacterium]